MAKSMMNLYEVFESTDFDADIHDERLNCHPHSGHSRKSLLDGYLFSDCMNENWIKAKGVISHSSDLLYHTSK